MMTAFIDHLKQEGLRPRTVGGIKSHLTCFLRWCEGENLAPGKATYQDLLAWLSNQQQQGLQAATINMRLRSLRRWYDYLQRAPNPARDLQVRKQQAGPIPDLLTPQQLEELHRQYLNYSRRKQSHEHSLYSQRNLAMLGLMIYQGLHSGELQQLEIQDIDLETGKLHVPEGTGRNGRLLSLQSVQLLILEQYLKETREQLREIRPFRENKLFDGYYLYNQVYHLIRRLKQLSGGQVTSARQIRTSVISYWLKQYHLREVQYMAGHRYVSSTLAYRQHDTEALRDQVQKHHPLG